MEKKDANSPADLGPELTLLPVSLFDLLQPQFDTLAVFNLNESGLQELTYTLERTVTKNALPGLVFIGLPYDRAWLEETERYRKLVETPSSFVASERANLAESPPPFKVQFEPTAASSGQHLEAQAINNTTVIMVQFPPTVTVQQECFLLIATAQFSLVMTAQKRAEPTANEALRLFDTLVSFEPAIIERSLVLVEEVVSQHLPGKLEQLRQSHQQFPPIAPSPAYLSFFTLQFIEQVGHYRHKMRNQDRAQAMRATIARLLHDASQPVTTLVSLLELGQRLRHVLPEEIDILTDAANELKGILDHLREVNKYRTSKIDDTDYLDTGKSFY